MSSAKSSVLWNFFLHFFFISLKVIHTAQVWSHPLQALTIFYYVRVDSRFFIVIRDLQFYTRGCVNPKGFTRQSSVIGLSDYEVFGFSIFIRVEIGLLLYLVFASFVIEKGFTEFLKIFCCYKLFYFIVIRITVSRFWWEFEEFG